MMLGRTVLHTVSQRFKIIWLGRIDPLRRRPTASKLGLRRHRQPEVGGEDGAEQLETICYARPWPVAGGTVFSLTNRIKLLVFP